MIRLTDKALTDLARVPAGTGDCKCRYRRTQIATGKSEIVIQQFVSRQHMQVLIDLWNRDVRWAYEPIAELSERDQGILLCAEIVGKTYNGHALKAILLNLMSVTP